MWQTEAGEYRCVALSGTNREKWFDEISQLVSNSATIPEMKIILSSYGVDQEDIIILPIMISADDYEYVSDELTIQRIRARFAW